MTKRRPSTFDLGINGNLDARYKREDLRIRNRIFGIVCGRYVPSKGHHAEAVVHIHLRCERHVTAADIDLLDPCRQQAFIDQD
jgi:hypothetical protein